jgi:hypothetical protein
MPLLIDKLVKEGFLTDHLALPGSDKYSSMKKINKSRRVRDDSESEDNDCDDGSSSYMGVCKLPG